MSKVIYVAGAISKGGIHGNVRRAFEAGLALLRAGLSPLVPHGTVFWGLRRESDGYADGYAPEVLPGGVPYADWMRLSIDLVRRCDAVLRLPGESEGADAECAEAGRRGIPVLLTVADVVAWAARHSETPTRRRP